jgi:hypothetical protein
MTNFSGETTGPEQVGDKVEGEIREFVLRDDAGLRQHPEDDDQVVADNISSAASTISRCTRSPSFLRFGECFAFLGASIPS